MKNKEKPKFNTAQNVLWMTNIAWSTRKRVLFFCLLSAATEVVLNLSKLYIVPEVLGCVEQKAPLSQLLLTIAFFTAILFFSNALKEYIDLNALFPRVDVRSEIIARIGIKNNTTSYVNTLDTHFLTLREKARYATDANDRASEHIWTTLTELLKNIGGFIVYLTILSNVDPLLLLVTVLTCLVGFFFSVHANNRRWSFREEEESYYLKKRYLRETSESVELAKDIRIFGLQNWLNELLDNIHDLYLDFSLKCERAELVSDAANAFLAASRNLIAYIYLINAMLKGGMSIPEFVLYFSAVTTFTEWITEILREAGTLHKESLDISRIREFLEYPEPFKFEDGESVPEYGEYELKLCNVSFRYPGAEKDTIHNMNLTVSPGEKLAIVGLNGAGKTTLVKLMCGLLDPTEGAVLLNGTDIKAFNRKSYYNLFSAVFQEFSLFDVTVAEEIAVDTKNIDYEKLNDCIKKAGLTSTVEKLPAGLNTHIGREVYLDGALFSGGQTQRLILARALYKNAPVLLLDEPTAALDPIAENDIYIKYNEMTAGKTSLFISHRLASTRFCDRIILIENGEIKEEGTHESLLSLGGEYAKLFEVQSKYYKEGKDF